MIALSAAFPVALSAFLSRRMVILLAVFLSIFMSRAFALTSSDNSFPITFDRLIAPVILVIVLPLLLKRIQHNRFDLFGIGLVHILIVIFATLVAGRFSTLVYIPDWFASSYLYILAGSIYVRHKNATPLLSRFVHIVTIALFILGVIEMILQAPLVSKLAEMSPNGVGALSDKALQGRIRDDALRLQIFADNPIRLGQYGNLLYAFILATTINRNKPYALILSAMLAFIVYNTGSRAGLAMFMILTFLALLRPMQKVKPAMLSHLLRVTILAGLVVAVFVGVQQILSYQSSYDSSFKFYQESTETRSNMARSLQVLWVFQTWRDSPLWGRGFYPNAGADIVSVDSLDSYVLRTLLESGIIGTFLFLAFALRYVPRAVKNTDNPVEFGYLAVTLTMLWGAFFEYTIETFSVSFFLLGYFEARLLEDRHRRKAQGSARRPAMRRTGLEAGATQPQSPLPNGALRTPQALSKGATA